MGSLPVHTVVLRWFRTHKRDLPWRAPDVTPWQVLVSEIMLQQTPAARVVPAWSSWIGRWPDPISLAHAKPAAVLRQWDRLGYPSRALRLQQTAQRVVNDHGGQLPANYQALIALPGIGDYTASAVLAFAFKRRSVVLDTNIRRVIARVWHGQERAPQGISVAEREFTAGLVPAQHARAAEWSEAIMELGATVCTMRSPSCQTCVLSDICQWRAKGFPRSRGTRKSQRFEGTDRQVRGIIMRQLREASRPVPPDKLAHLWGDRPQLDRALASLLYDGLVEQTASGRYRLPN